MEKKKLETVKRRFDWVTACGMLFFAAILVGELVVAVGVPLLVRREGVMAAKVTKVSTLEEFDARRRAFENLSESLGNETARYEASLAYGTLNMLADYLRPNADFMSTAQFNQVRQRLLQFRTIQNVLSKNQPFSERLDLDTSGVIARLAAPGLPAGAPQPSNP